jgi:hypothetical protein
MRKTKPFTIACNMLTCATLFYFAQPWPRETISGLFGRKAKTGGVLWKAGRSAINWMHKHEEDHCTETAWLEGRARQCLGYHE